MAVKSRRKLIRESLERQLVDNLGCAAAEEITPELRDQIDGYIRLFDRRRALHELLTNKGLGPEDEDFIPVGSRPWLEASKEDRQIAAEMRRVLEFLGLRPPDSVMGGGSFEL